jgi:hypothetical protein
MKENNRTLIIILIILSLEKFIQHVVVTYAFFFDLSGIRNSVVVDYRYLMIAGLIVGFLFLINIPFVYQRKSFSFIVLFFLALFDFSVSSSPRGQSSLKLQCHSSLLQ